MPPASVLRLWDDEHILIGHGLTKDLHALGLAHEMQRRKTYDTMTFPKFQGKGGSARSLKRLAKEVLGMEIQAPGKLHDPEDDARVVLQLYMGHARPRLLSNYDDLVAHYEQQLLALNQDHQRRSRELVEE